MITEPEAAVFVGQLAMLRRMPKDKAALRALIRMFSSSADDYAHGERIVEKLLAECNEWPGPVQLREVANRMKRIPLAQPAVLQSDGESMRRHFEENVKPWLCPKCEGWGVLDAGESIVRCTCEEGRPKWIDPATGKPCHPDHPNAAPYMDDAHVANLNRAFKQGKGKIAYKKAPKSEDLFQRPPLAGQAGS